MGQENRAVEETGNQESDNDHNALVSYHEGHEMFKVSGTLLSRHFGQ